MRVTLVVAEQAYRPGEVVTAILEVCPPILKLMGTNSPAYTNPCSAPESDTGCYTSSLVYAASDS